MVHGLYCPTDSLRGKYYFTIDAGQEKKCYVTEEPVIITPGHGKKIFRAIIIKLLHKTFAEALLISDQFGSKWKNLVAYSE